MLSPAKPIEQKGGSFFRSSGFSEAALQHLHDVLPRERNRKGFKRRKPVLLDVLGHGLEVRVVDAVAAERARPEKFGSSVEVGRIVEHDGRVADHRTQDAFDETFGDGRDVLRSR